jgi:hypothetical protein
VGRTPAGQSRRQRKNLERRRATRAEQARIAQRAQAEAAARGSDKERQRRHRVAYALWSIAALFAVSHFFEHLDLIPPITGSSGLDDLLVGWPMAGALAILAAIRYGT